MCTNLFWFQDGGVGKGVVGTIDGWNKRGKKQYGIREPPITPLSLHYKFHSSRSLPRDSSTRLVCTEESRVLEVQ